MKSDCQCNLLIKLSQDYFSTKEDYHYNNHIIDNKIFLNQTILLEHANKHSLRVLE